jgi:hypothetical protein
VLLGVRDIGGDGTWCLLCGNTLFLQNRPLQVGIFGEPADAKEPIPYIELTVCRKTGTRRKHAPKPPPLITFFRATAECADFFRAPASAGRFLVGLPANAEPNRVFGEALKNGEDRLHTHALPPLVAKAQAVLVGGGERPRNIGTQVDTNVELAPDGPHLPYIQLTQCWWKCPKCSDDHVREENSHE